MLETQEQSKNSHTEVENEMTVTKTNTSLSSEKVRLTILFGLLFVSIIGAVYFHITHRQPASETELEVVIPAAEAPVTTEKEIGNTDSVEFVWFTEARKIPDPKFVSEIDGDSSDFTYYAVGTYGSSTIVFLNYSFMGFVNLIFLSDAKETKLLLNHSSPYYSDYFKLSPRVSLDNKTKLAELSPDSTLSIGNNRTISSSYEAADGKPVPVSEFVVFDNSAFSEEAEFRYKNIEIVGSTTQGQILRGFNTTKEGTAMYNYALKLEGGLMVGYDANLPKYVSVSRVLQVVWDDTKTKNEDMYRIDGMGSCGGGGPEVAINKIAASDMALAGQTVTGEKVYVITNPTHPLIERVFEATQGLIYVYDDVSGQTVEKTITKEEFIKFRGVVVVEERDGTQLIFTHGKYGPQAECGKPVVYLYPEAVTDVTVKVDAYVTKSEPQYDATEGWKATAYPGGKLVVGGVEYESLFWDGYGNGLYSRPESGVIVSTDTALAVMAENLKTMGFIENEIADFVEFWSEYLPEEPYIRITWLQTAEMEQLAHLSISPRPDTLLRAFVDYEGVDVPYSITPQVLKTTKRNGYVAAEWGGLLRSR